MDNMENEIEDLKVYNVGSMVLVDSGAAHTSVKNLSSC